MENEKHRTPDTTTGLPTSSDEDLDNLKFEIDPNVIFQLGSELIADDITALIELVKNAYDADSDWVNVRVEPDFVEPQSSGMVGRITIEDAGDGMYFETIKHGWLLVSNSPKRAMKAKGDLTRKGRTPLGDKGLGRLGVQRLGRFCQLETCPTVDEEPVAGHGYLVRVDWDAFRNAEALSAVPFERYRIPPRVGTRITITGLNNPGVWRDAQTRVAVARKLSQLLFPFSRERPFEVYGNIAGWPIELDELAEKQLKQATLRYRFRFDGQVLHVDGEYRTNHLYRKGSRGTRVEQEQFEQLIQRDGGADFFAFLAEKKAAEDYGLSYLGRDGWFCSASLSIEAPNLHDSPGALVENPNPGPFRGELAEFTLIADDLDPSVFDSRSEYSEFVKRNRGVRIYRDGFAVGRLGFDGNDWLGLSTSQTKGSSWYELRPDNTIGYINISARENAGLVETSDRESLAENDYFRTFKALMDSLVASLNRATAFIRRTYDEFKAVRAQQDAGLSMSDDTMQVLDARVRETVDRANRLERAVGHSRTTIRDTEQRAGRTAADLAEVNRTGGYLASPEVQAVFKQAEETLTETQRALGQATRLLDNFKGIADELEAVRKTAVAMREEYTLLRDSLGQLTSLAGLGLSAEAISHELFTALDRLNEQTVEVGKLDVARGPRISSYLSYVRGSVAGLRKEVTRLKPGFYFVREVRERVSIGDYFAEAVRDHYAPRLKRKGLTIVCNTARDFVIDINVGKLNQVFDNLIFNAEYWLVKCLEKQRIALGEVHIEIDSPYVVIWDSGNGIEPGVQNSIFDPFITTKPKDEGRGLGLFIVRQLLDYYGCTISLLPETNQLGRRYKFRVDFSEVCVSGH